MLVHMGRTNIDIDEELVQVVMDRYKLTTKKDAVDYALRHVAGQQMTIEEVLAMEGSMPDLEAPEDTHPWS
jgi:Arc/MetJ family transcription regulator